MKQDSRSLRLFALMLALFGLLALGAGSAFGQAIDGAVVGTIVDTQGAVLVGVEVIATNVATNVTASSTTGSSGQYRFDHLLAGTYKISAKITGFKSITEQVDVELNKTTTRNLTLTPGATSETIEVSGTPPTIDTTTSQLQTTYESQILQDLPSATVGSGVLNASLLQAGVGSTGGLGAGSGPSVGGQRPRENNFTIEGTDNNDKGVTGPMVTVPNDAVANFTVIQNQFSPEFGHSAGGQFNQVVISGTNSIHGRAYEYFQNRNLNAIDAEIANQYAGTGVAPVNPRFDDNRFGGQVGGPIFKDKLFYFANFEYQPIGQAATTSSAACAPTAEGWNTISAQPGVNTTSVAGFAQYATAPQQSGAGSACPVTLQVNGAAIPIGVVPVIAPNYINNLALVTSMDWDVSGKDQVRGRYIYNKQKAIDTTAEFPAFYQGTRTPFHLVTLAEFHTFSPNIGNEFRIGFNRNESNTPVPSFKFPGLDAFPNLVIDNLNTIDVGPDPNGPQYATQNTYQLTDNLSWVKGNHTLKFGIDLRKQIDPQLFIQRSRGDYEWDTLQNFVNDQIPTVIAERSFGSVGYSGDDKMIGWFANDIWKVTKNLSLNLGLRYEYLSIPAGWKQQSLNAIANDPGLLVFGAPQAPKKDFMPRFGFAYSPGTSGNTSIRGGYSMGYDVLYDNIGTLARPPEIGTTVDCPQTCQTPFLQNGGIPPQPSSGITTFPTAAAARAATANFLPTNVQYPYAESWNLGVQHVFKSYTAEVRYVGSRGIHLPFQTRLNVQSPVTATNSVPTYLTAPSQAQLDALTVSLQAPPSSSNPLGGLYYQSYYCVTNCYISAPYLNAGFTREITSYQPLGASNYNGLQTQLQRRLTNGLQFQLAWTWSKTIDNATADFHSTDITPRRPQDFQNLAVERANSLLDHEHRVTFQVAYDVPWFAHDSNWLKKNLLGNYEFVPVYTWESGQWGTVQSPYDANLNTDGATDRVIYNASGNAKLGSDVTPLCSTGTNGMADCNNVISTGIDNKSYTVAYLATNPNAKYIAAGPGAFATSSRSNLQTPPINNFDITAAKHLKFGERYQVDFLAQAFNVLNHPQFVTGKINDIQTFGVTGGARDNFLPNSPIFNTPSKNFPSNARNMQLALKFSF